MHLLDFTKKLRSRKNVMIEGEAPTEDSVFIDSSGNQTKKETLNEGNIANFYKPENVSAREMIQAGLNLFIVNFLKGFKK